MEKEQEETNEKDINPKSENSKLLEEQKKHVVFDDVLSDLGEFGSYQKRAYFLLFIPTIFSAMQKQSWVFLGAKADHRCKLPEEPYNSSYYNPNLNLTARIPSVNDRSKSIISIRDEVSSISIDALNAID